MKTLWLLIPVVLLVVHWVLQRCNPHISGLILEHMGLIYKSSSLPPFPHESEKDAPWMNFVDERQGGGGEPVVWMVQLSDLHIMDPKGIITSEKDLIAAVTDRMKDLEYAMLHIIPHVIRPRLVLITGDMTHAMLKTEDNWLGTTSAEQHVEQWRIYHRLQSYVNEQLAKHWSTRRGTSLWWCDRFALNDRYVIDVRGNHDTFNVDPTDHAIGKLYVDHSSMGRHITDYAYHTGSRVFTLSLETWFGRYAFVGLDAAFRLTESANEIGFIPPLEFFGVVKERDLDDLAKAIADANMRHNHTIMFGHYPQSIIDTGSRVSRDGARLLDLSASLPYTAYLCGHLHRGASALWETLGVGNMAVMKARGAGHLELELADYKNERMMRIMAFDHDLFSFVDVPVHRTQGVETSEPILLVTNPKDCRYVAPSREPWNRMRALRQIRMLIFTEKRVQQVVAYVDNKIVGRRHLSIEEQRAVINGSNPMVKLPWNPWPYLNGVHTLRIELTTTTSSHEKRDVSGKSIYTEEHQFALDGTSCPLPIAASFLLQTDWSFVLPLAFGLITGACLTAFVIAWKYSYLNHISRPIRFYLLFHMLYTLIGGPAIAVNFDNKWSVVLPWIGNLLWRRTPSGSYQRLPIIDLRADYMFSVGIPQTVFTLVPGLIMLCVLSKPNGTFRSRKMLWLASNSVFVLYIVKRFQSAWTIVRRYGSIFTLLSPATITFPLVCVLVSMYEICSALELPLFRRKPNLSKEKVIDGMNKN